MAICHLSPQIWGCQHTFRPLTSFDPVPSRSGLSGLLSPFRHSRRVCVLVVEHPVSTSLRPFAPRALPRLNATMNALTPARTALRLHTTEHELRPNLLAGLPASRARPSRHSVPNHLSAPVVALTHDPSAQQASSARHRIELRHHLAGSLTTPAESGSLYYGLVFHLLLLPTPPHDDAVAVDYKAGACMPWRGLTPL